MKYITFNGGFCPRFFTRKIQSKNRIIEQVTSLCKTGGAVVAKFRETPCKYYVCLGECQKGRNAEYKGYCQKCSKYEPRAKMKHRNRKKDKIERQKRGDIDET